MAALFETTENETYNQKERKSSSSLQVWFIILFIVLLAVLAMYYYYSRNKKSNPRCSSKPVSRGSSRATSDAFTVSPNSNTVNNAYAFGREANNRSNAEILIDAVRRPTQG